MIRSSIRITVPSKKRGEIQKTIGPLIELCSADPACLGCHLYEDLQAKNTLMLEELWTSEEDLARHLRSDEYRNVLLVMELALKNPEIRFDIISSSTGIETIEKARIFTGVFSTQYL